MAQSVTFIENVVGNFIENVIENIPPVSKGDPMNGIDIEHSLESSLNTLGAHTVRSGDLDNLYKLDFVITHFDSVPCFRSIGVQVTTKRDNRSKMNEFATKQHSTVLAVYVELAGVSTEAFVAPLVYAALLSHANTKGASPVIGLRVATDGIEWFPVTATHAVKGDKLRGTLQRIHAKGYGFILGENNETFFYHATDIKNDPVLRDTVENLQKTADPWNDVNLPVRFVNNGFERENATNQSAWDVVRDLPSPIVVEDTTTT